MSTASKQFNVPILMTQLESFGLNQEDQERRALLGLALATEGFNIGLLPMHGLQSWVGGYPRWLS
jgi:hypothetical protein